MPDTGNAKDCLELPPTNFSIFTLKNVTWRTYLISFTVQYCFLFRFVCIELVSLIWVLQIWVAIYVYGTMINWSSLIKKLMPTYIVIVSRSVLNVSTVYLNGIRHLIWLYLSKPVLGGHPVLSGHYSIPQGCPLNTGFTVLSWMNLQMVCKERAKALVKTIRWAFWQLFIILLSLFASQAGKCSVLCDHCVWWGKTCVFTQNWSSFIIDCEQ